MVSTGVQGFHGLVGRTLDPELLHLRLQRGRLELQSLSCPGLAEGIDTAAHEAGGAVILIHDSGNELETLSLASMSASRHWQSDTTDILYSLGHVLVDALNST